MAAVALVEAVAGQALDVLGVVLEAGGAEILEGAADLAFGVVDDPVSASTRGVRSVEGDCGVEGEGVYFICCTTSLRSRACWRALVRASASWWHSVGNSGVGRQPQMAHEGCQSIIDGACASSRGREFGGGLRSYRYAADGDGGHIQLLCPAEPPALAKSS